MNRNGLVRRFRLRTAGLRAASLAGLIALPLLTQAQEPSPRAPGPEAGPASLLTVYIEALQRNAEYRAQLAATRAVTELDRAVAGKLLPQLGLGASYDYVFENLEGDYYSLPNVDSRENFARGVVGLKLTQALYQPELWISRDQSELRLNQSRFELEKAEDQLLLDVVGAYFGVLAAQDAWRLTQAESLAVERQLEQVRTRGQAGLALEAEVLAAAAQRSIAYANLIQAESRIDTARSALDLAAGMRFRDLKTLPEEGMPLERPEPADPQSWIARAREQNLDVVQARLSSQLAQLEAEKARSARLPRVDAVGSASYLDLDGGVSGARTEEDARIGVNLSLPLYTGGSVSAAIGAADAAVERANALVEAAQGRAERDTRVAFFALLNSLNKVPARADAVRAARASEEATVAGYAAGTRTNAEVLRAVEDRYDAERTYSAARYDYMLDSLRLKFSAGLLVNGDLSRFDRILRAANASP